MKISFQRKIYHQPNILNFSKLASCSPNSKLCLRRKFRTFLDFACFSVFTLNVFYIKLDEKYKLIAKIKIKITQFEQLERRFEYIFKQLFY